MLHPYKCPHCDSPGFVNHELIGKVVKCLNCGKIMILKEKDNANPKVPKTLHATVGKRLSVEDIKKMSAETVVHTELVNADDLEAKRKITEALDSESSQEIDADDLAVDD